MGVVIELLQFCAPPLHRGVAEEVGERGVRTEELGGGREDGGREGRGGAQWGPADLKTPPVKLQEREILYEESGWGFAQRYGQKSA